jgi:putative PIN family toxin of toxin-antitoxin system
LDTNVIVSALLFPDSAPGKALSEARRLGEMLLSADTVAEIVEVLRRPKFDRYVLSDERDWFIATLVRQATLVQPIETITVCRDPKDNKWLELAVSGKADAIVSGDEDLVSLDGYRDIAILGPKAFLASVAD